jgi:hypothetical protein
VNKIGAWASRIPAFGRRHLEWAKPAKLTAQCSLLLFFSVLMGVEGDSLFEWQFCVAFMGRSSAAPFMPVSVGVINALIEVEMALRSVPIIFDVRDKISVGRSEILPRTLWSNCAC